MTRLEAILESRKEVFSAVAHKIKDVLTYLSARGVDPNTITGDVEGALGNLNILQKGIDNIRAIVKLLLRKDKERLLQRLNTEERKLHDLKVELAVMMKNPSEGVLNKVQRLLRELDELMNHK